MPFPTPRSEAPLPMNPDLYSLQQSIEIDGIEQGVARYRNAAANRTSTHSTPERRIIGRAMELLVPAIDREKRRIRGASAKQGRPAKWWPPFLAVGSGQLALITLSEMLDWRDERKSTSMQIDIANMVRLELMYGAIRQHNKDRFGKTDLRTANWTKDEIVKVYRHIGLKPVDWSISEKLLLGGKLARMAMEATDMFNLRYCSLGGPKREIRIDPKPEIIDELLKQHSDLEILRPVLPPMMVPPVDWTPKGGGGYLFISKPLVREAFDNHATDYDIPSMQVPVEALNMIQSTPWRINTDVLDVYRRLWAAGGGCAGIPPAESPKPTEEQAKNRDWWRRRNQDNSRRFSVIRTLGIANEWRDRTMWFPHNLDFRGRAYPLTSYLHPQGDDLCRGLLVFDESLPLGSHGVFALKVFAANCAGQDKIALAARESWLNANWGQYMGDKPTYFDPLQDRRWMDYDSPAQFLGAMIDLNSAYLSGSPYRHESCLCVYIDGSNNGLQHLSALMRDPTGGEAVNLTWSWLPQDMYNRVAKAVSDRIRIDARTLPPVSEHGTPEPWALLDGKVDRTMVKRSTLAYPYGISGFGMKLALMQDGHLDGMADNLRPIAGYLARQIASSIGDVVVKAAELMRWLQTVARMLGEAGHPVPWVAPHGFPVCQRYLIKDRREIKTALHRCTVLVPAADGAVDLPAQARGVVANVIHSIDAAHLLGVALQVKEQEWEHAAWIHDSVGVHACRIDQLHRIVRDEFVALHENDILGNFIAGLDAGDLELPPPPAVGDLDLRLVRTSPYFFA
jgi:DNA-directed RNA polymerase